MPISDAGRSSKGGVFSNGAHHASSRDKPRERALRILKSSEAGAFADELLAESRSMFDHRDNAFILELVYGSLRNRSWLDWSLDQFSAQPVGKTDGWTRNILRLGSYQLLFLDKVPPSAAVNTSTELAKTFGKKSGYVNGLLRALERKKKDIPLPALGDPAKNLAIRHSHPEWLVRRWMARVGLERTEQALKENNRPAPLILRANTLKTTRPELRAALEADGATARETAYAPQGMEITASPGLQSLSAFQKGMFIIQDEAGQLVSMLLAPKPGEAVLDACAAPGGKATHLAELMRDQGTVIALESDPRRLERLRENIERLGITAIKPIQGDAATYAEGVFDKILIDAPCSGLGVLRRHPDGRWAKTERGVRERGRLQRELLANCARLLKPGGALVYATCTTEPEENEEVIAAFLAGHPEFTLDDPRPFLPESAAQLVDDNYYFRTFPEAPEMDGFFGARMVRK